MEKKIDKTDKAVYQNPKRTFEKSGSVDPRSSYYVPIDNVVNRDKQDLKTMVDGGRYFSIFAPRQSGKTTFLKRFCQELESDRTYIAIFLSFEKYSNVDVQSFYSQIQKNLYKQLLDRLTLLDCDKLGETVSFLDQHTLIDHLSFGELFEQLNQIILHKKIVIFIDEFDGIPEEELGNFLNTIRDLYLAYKEADQKALYSVGLIGIRNVTKLIVGGVSPFNIADQVDMPPFSFQNIIDLYAQYTEETNQPFSPEAIKRIHQETSGQPWLVNRLGTLLTIDVKPGTIDPILETDVEQAINSLLMEKNNHFDNLYEKAGLYKETFIKIVFNNTKYRPNDNEQSWLEQYGLIKREEKKAVVANRIYKERFVAAFFDEVEIPENISPNQYLLPGDLLDIENIILDFEQYVTRIGVGAFYRKGKPYEKAGQFLLTAWLYQFVKNGGGELRYEASSGLGIMDVLLIFKGKKYIIETKINHHNHERTLNQGISQLAKKYLATESIDEGYLIIFDPKTPLGEPCEPQFHQSGNKKITSFTIAIGKSS
jgi:hypothetical protein